MKIGVTTYMSKWPFVGRLGQGVGKEEGVLWAEGYKLTSCVATSQYRILRKSEFLKTQPELIDYYEDIFSKIQKYSILFAF